MPIALLLPILLRIAGPVAFLFSVASAGAMNRSVILVPIIAVAATVTTILIRIIAPSPASEINSMLSGDPNPSPESPFRGSGRRLGIGLVGYALIFGLSAWVAALFQTTEFEPQVLVQDIWFVISPAVIAIIGAWISARMGFNQMANMMGQMQTAFADMKANANGAEMNDDDFTVEGEIIDPDESKTS